MHNFTTDRARLSMLACASFACLSFAAASARSSAERPNIVLIFADDLGWQDPTFAGSDYCETPNLDRLASQGMVFRQAYAAAGNCAPSRACLVSGQYTPRHGVYAVGTTNRGPKKLMRMVPTPNKLTLPRETVTMAEALRGAGYATGMFGKCHLSAKGGGKSEHAGFDVVAVSQHSLNSRDPEDPKGIFSITDAACDFIEANRERPFFAYVAHYAVHSAVQSRAATLERFERKPDGKEHNDPKFAACVAELDAGVGQLLDKLDALELSETTLVVFTSDNGGTAWSQEPLRGKKGAYYEGGIRVPMIVRWPSFVEPGAICDEPAINVDLYPTFLAAAHVAPPTAHVLDGTSLLPLFERQAAFERDAVFWHFPGYLDGPVPRGRDPVFRTRPVSVIRKHDWKLLLYHEEWQLDGGRDQLDTNRAVELYNLGNDPGERHDLASANPAKRDELLESLLTWISDVPAPMPTERNPSWQPDLTKAVSPEN